LATRCSSVPDHREVRQAYVLGCATYIGDALVSPPMKQACRSSRRASGRTVSRRPGSSW
jgi:hypothetical protein